MDNSGTNIHLISVPSSSRVEAAYVGFRLYKCLCLKWATRANAPLVYRFHSLTHSTKQFKLHICLTKDPRFYPSTFVSILDPGFLPRVSILCPETDQKSRLREKGAGGKKNKLRQALLRLLNMNISFECTCRICLQISKI